MTYRDFSTRQLTRFRSDCQRALAAYQRIHPNEIVNLSHWQTAWGKAFIAGVNVIAERYRDTPLFPVEPLKENKTKEQS